MRLKMCKVKIRPSAFFLVLSSSALFYFAIDLPIPYPPHRCETYPLEEALEIAKKHGKRELMASKKISKLSKACLPPEHTLLVYSSNVPPENLDFKQGFSVYEYAKYLFDGRSGMPETVEDTFDRFPPQKKCAVVGNGGILKGSGCGTEINTNYDFVFRSNVAPIKEYADDVGIKTNLTLINLETIRRFNGLLARKNSDPETKAFVDSVRFLNESVIWYPKGIRFRFYSRIVLQTFASKLKDDYKLPIRLGFSWRSVAVTIKEFWSMTEFYATTGLISYTIATTLCDEITLYGFYPFNVDSQGHGLPFHYYESTPRRFNTSVHDFPAEYDHLTKLEKIGALKLVTGKCNE